MKKQFIITLLCISTLALLPGCWGKKDNVDQTKTEVQQETTPEAKETVEPTVEEQQQPAE